MSKTIDLDFDGYVPAFDDLLQNPKYSAVGALVFGKIWTYCQGKYGKCVASVERMAKELGISRKTFHHYLPLLVQDGYLTDLTPNLEHVTHEYADGGLLVTKGKISVTKSNTSVTLGNTSVTLGNTNRSVIDQKDKSLSPAGESNPSLTGDSSLGDGRKNNKDKTSPLQPSTPAEARFLARLAAEAAARGRRGAARFPSLVDKVEFDRVSAGLSVEQLDRLIDKAIHGTGSYSMKNVLSYMAKVAEGMAKAVAPVVPAQKAQDGGWYISQSGRSSNGR